MAEQIGEELCAELNRLHGSLEHLTIDLLAAMYVAHYTRGERHRLPSLKDLPRPEDVDPECRRLLDKLEQARARESRAYSRLNEYPPTPDHESQRTLRRQTFRARREAEADLVVLLLASPGQDSAEYWNAVDSAEAVLREVWTAWQEAVSVGGPREQRLPGEIREAWRKSTEEAEAALRAFCARAREVQSAEELVWRERISQLSLRAANHYVGGRTIRVLEQARAQPVGSSENEAAVQFDVTVQSLISSGKRARDDALGERILTGQLQGAHLLHPWARRPTKRGEARLVVGNDGSHERPAPAYSTLRATDELVGIAEIRQLIFRWGGGAEQMSTLPPSLEKMYPRLLRGPDYWLKWALAFIQRIGGDRLMSGSADPAASDWPLRFLHYLELREAAGCPGDRCRLHICRNEHCDAPAFMAVPTKRGPACCDACETEDDVEDPDVFTSPAKRAISRRGKRRSAPPEKTP